MNIRAQLHDLIQESVKEIGLEVTDFDLSHPPSAAMGDYSTNAALLGAKQAGKNQRELAEEVITKLRNANSEWIDRVEVAGPGFINFYLQPDYFVAKLKETLSEDFNLSLNTSLSGKKVMVEFTDPNPFKEFHIGHLYSNSVGESIARLLEASGAEVKRANYQGDVGLHVAKAVWGMGRQLTDNNQQLTDITPFAVEDRAKWLGEAYALGAAAYEEDAVAKDEIIQINRQVYEEDPEVHELYMAGRQWSLDYFEMIYARLGMKFDYYYFESKAGPRGLEIVKEFLSKGVFKESQGAVIFPGEDHGLHTRVFINSLGLPTYEAKELGLAFTKEHDFPFDISISVTGNEINEYFKVLIKALSLIKPELAEKIRHISHGMVRLPEGKMSSRKGNVLTGEWLLNEAKSRLRTSYPGMGEETLEIVAVGAVKWALLRSGIGKDISFNIDESVSFEGDSGPYIQYTYARTESVLRKSEIRNPKSETNWTFDIGHLTLDIEELTLLKLLDRYSEVVEEAGKHYSPNLVTNYLFDLAQAFNHFYQKQRILDPENSHPREGEDQQIPGQAGNDNIRTFRLALTQATGNVLRSGLHLLGIKAPEKM
jgi:arginyl-tRNA synthetase